jgi:transposase
MSNFPDVAWCLVVLTQSPNWLFWVVCPSWRTKLVEQLLQFHFGIDVSHKAMRMASL